MTATTPSPKNAGITVDCGLLVAKIVEENAEAAHLLREAGASEQAKGAWRLEILSLLKDAAPSALAYYERSSTGRKAYEELSNRDIAAIRILDYIDYGGQVFEDQNVPEGTVASDPVTVLWEAVANGNVKAEAGFWLDWLFLLRQYRGELDAGRPERRTVQRWMGRFPSGTDTAVIAEHEANRDRILRILLREFESGRIRSRRFRFDEGLTKAKKLEVMRRWWDDHRFHLKFAVRSAVLLNEMLDNSVDDETMAVLRRAEEKGIPFFVNPYYLSLLMVHPGARLKPADLAVRQYIFYGRELVDEFGHISAWEKEDEVRAGSANAAGWILPARHAVHRRYPEVAILIPETVGRACGGLCASCQRMYDFQSGHLNFDLDKLQPDETFEQRLNRFLKYFEEDTQLRDILITGGDALMSSNASLSRILDAVYQMAANKREANLTRPDGEKYAEMVRIRLGTRLPVYLPQRVNESLSSLLGTFRKRAAKIGFKQFVIQTHFESPMEVTPEAVAAIHRLTRAGWIVTNQLVFTAAASRRGHTARLRQVLNDAGVLTYYTFTVKGFRENRHNFAPNARAVQEQMEEKYVGRVPTLDRSELVEIALDGTNIRRNVNDLRDRLNVPFLATDRNVLNLPGVGKSLTFRTIGLTADGRRVLIFDHDHTRRHSPIIDHMGLMSIVESKSIADYLEQLEGMGEDRREYESIWGYSIGETERRMPIYEYPPYPFEVTQKMSNLDVAEAMEESRSS